MSILDPIEDNVSGFTLIEAIASLLILAMVLGGITVSISYSIRLLRRANEIDETRHVAQTLIAERFDRRPGQLELEEGRDGSIEWRITRQVLASDFTARGGRLIDFQLELFDRAGKSVGNYDSMYVEAVP